MGGREGRGEREGEGGGEGGGGRGSCLVLCPLLIE